MIPAFTLRLDAPEISEKRRTVSLRRQRRLVLLLRYSLKPVLTVQGEKLDAFAEARTMKQAEEYNGGGDHHRSDLEERFGDRAE